MTRRAPGAAAILVRLVKESFVGLARDKNLQMRITSESARHGFGINAQTGI
jgi:hypothetical protein